MKEPSDKREEEKAPHETHQFKKDVNTPAETVAENARSSAVMMPGLFSFVI